MSNRSLGKKSSFMPLGDRKWQAAKEVLGASITEGGIDVHRLRRFELVLHSAYAVKGDQNLADLDEVIGDPVGSIDEMLGRFEGEDPTRMGRLIATTRGVLDSQRRMCETFITETTELDEDSKLEFTAGQMLELAESYRCCCVGEIPEVRYSELTSGGLVEHTRDYIGDQQVRHNLIHRKVRINEGNRSEVRRLIMECFPTTLNPCKR